MIHLERSRFLTRLPVRWRLGLASAGLTLIILVAFAMKSSVGATADRIRGDFNDELSTGAAHTMAAGDHGRVLG